MASILKSSTVKGGLSSIIDAGIGLALGFVAGLFSGKAKKEIAALQSNADALMIKNQAQSKTLKTLLIVFGIVAAIIIFLVIRRRRK